MRCKILLSLFLVILLSAGVALGQVADKASSGQAQGLSRGIGPDRFDALSGQGCCDGNQSWRQLSFCNERETGNNGKDRSTAGTERRTAEPLQELPERLSRH